MPIEIIYLGILLVAICVVFVTFKRPIYEAMFFGYVVMIAVTNEWGNFFTYMVKTSTNTLFYAIVAFLAAAQIFGGTKVIDKVIEIILSIFGRMRGGAGYVSLIGSTFMGALSGSGAGNVAATGVFTIPAMKKSGFPSYLAANVEMSASTMGNMIPPAGVITAAFGTLAAISPDFTMSDFWLVVWGIALWFILQRAITLYVFCKVYDVKPMTKEELPKLGTSFKNGWKALLLALVIFLPFFLDSKLNATFFTAQLGGDGAKSLSSCILLFTPGLAALYAMLIARKDCDVSPKAMAGMFSKVAKSIVPVSATIFFAYSISNLFETLKVGSTIGEFVSSWGLPLFALALLIPLFCAVLGMIMPGSSQIAIFGTAIVTILVGAGANPILVAAILPAITGAMEGMTPPLALCMYTAMGIAESPMKETTKNCIIWVGLHYAMSVLCLIGVLPILGLK